jgi:starch phosphorylase
MIIGESRLESEFIANLSKMYDEVPSEAPLEHIYGAMAAACRDRLEAKRTKFKSKVYGDGDKEVYYMCIEYLIGRSLKNNLFNLGIEDDAEKIFRKYGTTGEKVYECEKDAGLGNGGLGRLAASYLDSFATLEYPGNGYGLLYEYGIFKQKIVDGWQNELPDEWLDSGRVWLRERRDEAVEVRLGGKIDELWDRQFHHTKITDYDSVMAIPYDMYISGYHSDAVTKLRLWYAEASSIDMQSFNNGDFAAALKRSQTAELISKVLYPNDNNVEGKLLRLKQQYFLCSASMNDIVKKHLAQYGTFDNFSEKIAIHINDTHPTLAIPELIRILLDDCGYGWDDSLKLAHEVFSYTNHTVLSEALEQWDVELLTEVCPRCLQIINEIDKTLEREIAAKYPGDESKQKSMRIVYGGKVRMANMCAYVCHSINGVSKLHSGLVKTELFPDFAAMYPEKFKNVTNGVSYRRWVMQDNPGLTSLITDTIGKGFTRDPMELRKLMDYKDDSAFLDKLLEVKHNCKVNFLEKNFGDAEHPYDPNSIFDVQVKRMHEYKRQHLNALHILTQYLEIKNNPGGNYVPRTYVFGAKAASGYYMAKQIIRLLFAISRLLDSDPDTRGIIRLLYLEDYKITTAEQIIPAAEISEQISLAGYEASGTGCMKLMYNGAVTIGTLDGANIEIRDAAGEENFLLFGMNASEAKELRKHYRPMDWYNSNPKLKEVIDFIDKGFAGQEFHEIVNNLKNSDPYMVLADYQSYVDAQRKASELYRDRHAFARMELANIANAGIFSSDRAVEEYAENIWNLRKQK